MKNEKYSKMLIPSILSVSLLTIMAPTAISPALAAIKEGYSVNVPKIYNGI